MCSDGMCLQRFSVRNLPIAAAATPGTAPVEPPPVVKVAKAAWADSLTNPSPHKSNPPPSARSTCSQERLSKGRRQNPGNVEDTHEQPENVWFMGKDWWCTQSYETGLLPKYREKFWKTGQFVGNKKPKKSKSPIIPLFVGDMAGPRSRQITGKIGIPYQGSARPITGKHLTKSESQIARARVEPGYSREPVYGRQRSASTNSAKAGDCWRRLG
jgi:hypothetical protein